MKLLRITAEGLPLFKKRLDLVFYAQQRVAEDDKAALYPLFSNEYLNPAIGFIGVNASGKTSVLKVISMVLDLLNNESLNHISTREILGDTQCAVLNSYFFSEDTGEVCRLETMIASKKSGTGEIRYYITDERLWSKKAADVKTRKTMTDFSGRQPAIVRDAREEFLPGDVSIMIAYNKKTRENVLLANLLHFTNMNLLPFSDDIPAEVIPFLDPSIEYIHFDRRNEKVLIRLKFRNKDEITLNDPVELNLYLSSGTVKGMVIFTHVRDVLQTGGYLIVDELENHFNKEIASTLMRFFMDSRLNRNGGILIFSTHYPELLDEFDRNDSIFITRNRDGITAENLTNILKRNDMKKSEAYQSGFLEGTTPTYEAYIRLKKSIAEVLC